MQIFDVKHPQAGLKDFNIVSVLWVKCSDFFTDGYGDGPGTHLEKNRESQPEPMSPKLKMPRPLCNQTICKETPKLSVLQKLKYSPSILKHNKG